MKISYNWLKWYIPDVLTPEKLADVFTYHLAEVEDVEKKGDDHIFDINILPNRAHDLLSHQGIAREVASQLGIDYVDPTPKYKVPESRPTALEIKVESDKCRRYMGRIVRNVKVGPSPDWVKEHLESIGQRSINNVVDGANITMYDCGQPIHAFDLDKVSGALVIRMAREGEEITTLDNKQVKLRPVDLVIADEKNVLSIAGVKGGKIAEVDENTKNIIIEVANFDPASVRKTGKTAHIFTDALKRFENDLSPTLGDFSMLEMSALMAENGATDFEDIVDIYPNKQEAKTLSFRQEKISNILGTDVSAKEIADILDSYHIEHTSDMGTFTITVPPMRLDLVIEEDMAEEIGRIMGYDKLVPKIPQIDFKPKVNETHAKIAWARSKLLAEGYSEVMTYAFAAKGEVEVLESASDKKFMRTNLTDGLKESLKLNRINAALLDAREIKIFEIGNIFLKDKQEVRVAYNEKDKIIEVSLDEFSKSASPDALAQVLGSPSPSARPDHSPEHAGLAPFKMWSLFPFIARDIAVWVPEDVSAEEVENVIRDEMGALAVKGPTIFDEFEKDGKVSYAFKIVFQAFGRTLTDAEINEIMTAIANKLKTKDNWQVR